MGQQKAQTMAESKYLENQNVVIDLADENDCDQEHDHDHNHDHEDYQDIHLQHDINSNYKPNFANIRSDTTTMMNAFANNNNNNNAKTSDISANSNYEPEPGDLVWFDPNLYGHSIPGKIVQLDNYQGQGHNNRVLIVEGCAQVYATLDVNTNNNSQNQNDNDKENEPKQAAELNLQEYNSQLESAELNSGLQLYHLSDFNQLQRVKPRRPIEHLDGHGDLIDIQELSLELIVWNLKLRYKQRPLVYTRCGQRLLISVNPYKQVSELYNLEQVNSYANNDGCIKLSSSSLIRWLQIHEPELQKQMSPNNRLTIEDHRTTNTNGNNNKQHLFSMASECLKTLKLGGQDQHIVLLGDSGSGKTEATKLLLQYYAAVTRDPVLLEQMLESMQILESFGHAKTVSNWNSSRFAKLIELQFNHQCQLLSANIHELHLLDRSRIFGQIEGERNYHVFYELLAGLSRQEREKYGLQQQVDKYFYLNQGNCNQLPVEVKSDLEDFRSLLASLQVLGFNQEEQDAILRLLASILHLGNVYFHRRVLGTGATTQQQHQETADNLQTVEGVEIGSTTEVGWVSHLLQIHFDSVLGCLTTRTTFAPNEQASLGDRIVTPLNIDQALDSRDALARALYTCLFRWVVQRINAAINASWSAPKETSGQVMMCRTSESQCEFQPDKLSSLESSLGSISRNQQSHRKFQSACITILDTFGFERSQSENNFETLCINYYSELLNYQAHKLAVRLEQAEYAREKLVWAPLGPLTARHLAQPSIDDERHSQAGDPDFRSSVSTAHGCHSQSAAVVSLIGKRPLGIFALLDDECNFPKAADVSFVEKCHHNHALNDIYFRSNNHNNNNHNNRANSPYSISHGHLLMEFGIKHFGHQQRLVWYQAEGFVEKNRDCLRPDLQELLSSSKLAIINSMMSSQLINAPNCRQLQTSTSSHYSSSSLSTSDKQSTMASDYRTISRTHDGRYVCMKPRAATICARFQDSISSSRLFEALNARKQASRTSEHNNNNDPPVSFDGQHQCWFIMCLKPNRSQTPELFDVAHVQEQAQCFNLLELVTIRTLGYPYRLRYSKFARQYKCLAPVRKFSKVRDLCHRIVSQFDEHQQDHQFGLTRLFLRERLYERLELAKVLKFAQSIVIIQKSFKMLLVRRKFLLERRAATKIQAQVRGHLARRMFWVQYNSIVFVQRRWRHIYRQRRLAELDRKRKQQIKVVQTHHMDEMKQQSNQYRFRMALVAQDGGQYAGSALEMPIELCGLLQMDSSSMYEPIHGIDNIQQVDFAELIRREQLRLSKHSQNVHSVPFLAFASKHEPPNAFEAHAREWLEKFESDEGANERYSLRKFLFTYFGLESPLFGYSRLPITRPFNWVRIVQKLLPNHKLQQNQQQPIEQQLAKRKSRLRAIKLKAMAIYKLLLRYIDSGSHLPLLNGNGSGNSDQSSRGASGHDRRLAKLKLIVDYVISLCLCEVQLRDEVYLQLVSLSWQNNRIESRENLWKFMLCCLACFGPSDFELTQFLIRYVADYCSEQPFKYLLCDRLAIYACKTTMKGGPSEPRSLMSVDVASGRRRYPNSMLEYTAIERGHPQSHLMVPVSFYMDSFDDPNSLDANEEANGDDQDDANYGSSVNHSRKTLTQVDSFACGQLVARMALEARGIKGANSGWTVELEFEGNMNELSCRLRGDQSLLDAMARVEMSAKLRDLIEDPKSWNQSASWLAQPRDHNYSHNQQLYYQPAHSDVGLYQQYRPASASMSRCSRRLSYQSDQMSCQSLYGCKHKAKYATNETPQLNGHVNRKRRNSSSGFWSDEQAGNRLSLNSYVSSVSNYGGVAPLSQRPSRAGRPLQVDAKQQMIQRRRSLSMQDMQHMNNGYGYAPGYGHNYGYGYGYGGYASNYFGHEHSYAPTGSYATRRVAQANGYQPSGALSQHYASSYVTASGKPKRRLSKTSTGSMLQLNELAGARMSSGSYGRPSRPLARSGSHSSIARSNRVSSLWGVECCQSPQYQYAAPDEATYYVATSDRLPVRHRAASCDRTNYARVPLTNQQQQQQLSKLSRAVQSSSNKQAKGLQSKVPRTAGARNGQSKSKAAVEGNVSSARSDTSEAPSLASHVKAIKVPKHNSELDQYLDDLFSPMLNECELDEMSDAKSLATSIRGRDHDDATPTNMEKTDQEQEPASGQLSPTFESMLKDLRATGPSEFHRRDEHVCEDPAPSRVIGDDQLSGLNLNELKALNERLESEIEVVQSERRQSAAILLPPADVNDLGVTCLAGDAINTDHLVLDDGDDPYARAKTIRIGKWRWPPPADQQPRASMQTSPPDEDLGQQVSASTGFDVEASSSRAKPVLVEPIVETSNPERSKLNISQEMKAKLEQLTTSNAIKPTSQVTGASNEPKEQTTKTSGPVKGKIADQRRKLLERQLQGANQRQNDTDRLSVELGAAQGKVMSAKQQLALAAGVALSALDTGSSTSGSQSSSRRQSALVDTCNGIVGKRLSASSFGRTSSNATTTTGVGIGLSLGAGLLANKHDNDELGPQSSSAVSQREAFYRNHSGDQSGEQPPLTVQEHNAPVDHQPGLDAVPIEAVSVKKKSHSPAKPLGMLERHHRDAFKTKKAALKEQVDEPSLSERSQLWVRSSPEPQNSARPTSDAAASSAVAAPKPKAVAKNPNHEPNDLLQGYELNTPWLAYANVNWMIRIRKEIFMPSETYDDPLVLQLIFSQLVADIFNPNPISWPKLSAKERATLKALMKDNAIGYSRSLPPIGHLQDVKRELVRMARSFGLYFTRMFEASNARELSVVNGSSRGDSSSIAWTTSSDEDDEDVDYAKSLEDSSQVHQNQPIDQVQLANQHIDSVALHHSGLRLVRFDLASKGVVEAGLSGGHGGASGSYKVLETLKFRDLAYVRLTGKREFLVCMQNTNTNGTNARSSWLLRSNQAAQLVSLLKCFHCDYVSHLEQPPAADKIQDNSKTHSKKSLSKPLSNNNNSNIKSKHTSIASQQQDDILALNDDNNADYSEKRQTSTCISNERSMLDANPGAADRLPTVRLPRDPGHTNGHPPVQAHARGGSDKSPVEAATGSGNTLGRRAKGPAHLWQDSLSRMSGKFSLFAGTTGGQGARESTPLNSLANSWLETKVDFCEDDDDDEDQDTDDSVNPTSESVKNKSSIASSSLQTNNDVDTNSIDVHKTNKSDESNAESPSQTGAGDQGKYSMLQFALYNFREAIDKYSLESRAQKMGTNDTGTLRGSLKLIETLRSRATGSRAQAAAKADELSQTRSSSSPKGSSTHTTDKNNNNDANTINNNNWTWRELAQMVKHTDTPLAGSLLKMPNSELDKRARECFLAIMRYMGDLPKDDQEKQDDDDKDTSEIDCVYLILMSCHNYSVLRDEVYCQLIKQTTNNRNLASADSCLRGWRLFCIVAAYFQCSQHLKPYLLNYLESVAYDKRRAYCSVAQLCLKNLRKTFKFGGRKNVPSIEELAAISAGRNSKRQIYRLPGGTDRVINTKTSTVVDDIIQEVCSQMLQVTDENEMLEFSLYCIAENEPYTMALNRHDYILDVTTELIKNNQRYFLIFCRSIWYYPLRLDCKLYIEVTFNQIAPDYLEGLMLVLPKSWATASQQNASQGGQRRLKSRVVREMARIGALLHRASGTEHSPRADEIELLLPNPIVACLDTMGSSNAQVKQEVAAREVGSELLPIDDHSTWFDLIVANWREMSSFDTLDAKAQFLDLIRVWPLFGSSFFAVKLMQRDLIDPMDYTLALNKSGVQMLHTETHQSQHSYPFNEIISTRKVRSEDGTLYLDLKCGNLMKCNIIRIQTDQAHEISRLIKQYIDIELVHQKHPHQQTSTQIGNHQLQSQSQTQSQS